MLARVRVMTHAMLLLVVVFSFFSSFACAQFDIHVFPSVGES